jgi:RNA polymerase sigma factor (sigma-70 family)
MESGEPLARFPDLPGRTVTSTHDHGPADELLAVRCQLGEPAAFDELIERWHGPLWTYVRRLVGADDPARELVQDVWIRVIRGIPRLRDGSKLRAWLFGIARRTVMDRLRAQYAHPIDTDVDLDEVPAETWTSHDEADLQEMERALGRLPAVERDVLTLFYLEELSLTDIAGALGVPVGTVKSRLFRARRMLREEMHAGGSRS